MNKFNYALKRLLEIEGDYSNHKDDPGLCTYKGISLRSYKLLTGNEDADCNTLLLLTDKQVRDFYFKYFWREGRFDLIDNIDLCTKAFILGVHAGPRNGVKVLQRTVNSLYENKVLKVDGILGKNTANYTNNLYVPDISDVYSSYTMEFYERVLASNPKLEVFRDGWKTRAYKNVSRS